MYCKKLLLIESILFSSVGTKESGTRFLTYVDAVLGFKHLLTTADLDKALSLCTGMRGKLRSRFLVLSDDRVLPPPPVRPRGKRKQDSLFHRLEQILQNGGQRSFIAIVNEVLNELSNMA